MRGIDLMLLGIYAVTNFTGPIEDNTGNWVLPDRFNWEVDLNNAKVSLADSKKRWEAGVIPTKLKVTTWEDPPYSWAEGTEGNYTGHGYAFDIFNALLANLNLTYEIVKPTTSLSMNESNGVMQLLHEKEVDVAVGFIPIMPDLLPYCSYGPILGFTDITVILKRPRVSAVGSGLLAPFSTTVWICILISLIIYGPVIFFFTSYRSRIFGGIKEDIFPLYGSIWFSYGALLKQGSTYAPINNSTRLIFATWLLFITIVTSFYTANLTAFLTLSEFTLRIKSVEDIVNTGTYWIAQKQHIIDYTLQMGHGGKIQELQYSLKYGYGKFVTVPWEMKAQEIERITRTNQVFITEMDLIDTIIHRDYMMRTHMNIIEKKRCTLVMMPQHIYRQNRAFAYPRGSPIQEKMDKQLLHLVETGIIMHMQSTPLPIVRYCPLDLQSKERQLSNDDLSLTYKVIATGYAIAIFVYIIEMLQRWTNYRLCSCFEEACPCCQNRTIVAPNKRLKIPSAPSGPFSIVIPKNSSLNKFTDNPEVAQKQVFNGRDYWMITQQNGFKRLVPIRTPSAMLFQYTS